MHRLSLSAKIMSAIASFFMVLACLIIWRVAAGFRDTQQTAFDRSNSGFEEESQAKVLALTQLHANLFTGYLQQVVVALDQIAGSLEMNSRSGVATPWKPIRDLERDSRGVYFDGARDRVSDIYIPNGVVPTAALDASLRRSALLDLICPAIMAAHSDILSTFYIGPEDYQRSYPPEGFHEVAEPDLPLASHPFFLEMTPEENPERAVLWTPVYEDAGKHGLLVTARKPLYVKTVFMGVIGADITLDEFVADLTTIRITPNSYAFLIDQAGTLIAVPPEKVPDLASTPTLAIPVTSTLGIPLSPASPDFKLVVDAMKQQDSGIRRIYLNGKTVFVSYAPLPNVGWSLGIVTPLDELTEHSKEVSSAIEQGTQSTIGTTLWLVIILLIGSMLCCITYLQRFFIKPINILVNGNRAVAQGKLIPLELPAYEDNKDEFGMLLHSFNTMVRQLIVGRELEQQNNELMISYTAAQQANVLKTQFLSTMSHELRTPLNSIINMTKLLSWPSSGPLTTEQRVLQTRVLHNSQHLLRLINEILDLAKIEAGHLVLKQGATDLGMLVKDALGIVAGLNIDKGLEFIVDIADLSPVWVDAIRIQQVVLNLLSNAIKFTEAGSITITATSLDTHWILVAIADTGRGMSQAQQEHIFEEFQQVHLDTHIEGTGLGLAISKRLIELHGGSISVVSTLGLGSTFSFTLPTCREPVTDGTQDLIDEMVQG